MRTIVLAAMLVLGASALDAQIIRGTVRDDLTKRPVAQALVALLDSTGRDAAIAGVRTDAAGAFTLYIPTPGIYQVRVSRIGFRPAGSPLVRVGEFEVAVVQISLTVVAERLTPITVVESRRLTMSELESLQGFEYRCGMGYGQCWRAEALREMQSFADLAMTGKIPGAIVTRDGGIVAGGVGGRPCVPKLYVDGFLTREFPPNTLFAIETYGAGDHLPMGAVPGSTIEPQVTRQRPGSILGGDPSAIAGFGCIILGWTKGWFERHGGLSALPPVRVR